MPSSGDINFNDVDYDINKCRGIAEINGNYHSYPYLCKADIEVPSEDNYDVIK